MELLIATAGLTALGIAGLSNCAPELFTAVWPSAAQAPAPKVGTPAPTFSAVDTRGAAQSLAAYKGKWVVLEWFNHDCPYTQKHYNGGNTQALQKDFTKRGVVWLSIVSSAPGKEGFKSVAASNQLTIDKGASPTAVIRDTAGVIGRLYGARTTPQYAIIDPAGVLRYAGAIDDKPTSKAEDIKTAHNYVRAALDAGLAGKAIAVSQSQPYGCTVQY